MDKARKLVAAKLFVEANPLEWKEQDVPLLVKEFLDDTSLHFFKVFTVKQAVGYLQDCWDSGEVPAQRGLTNCFVK
jgi:hypothetical protein